MQVTFCISAMYSKEFKLQKCLTFSGAADACGNGPFRGADQLVLRKVCLPLLCIAWKTWVPCILTVPQQ